MQYSELIDNIVESTSDSVLSAFWDDDKLHLASLERELREVCDRYLRHATPIRGSMPSASGDTRPRTLADIPFVNVGAALEEANSHA